MSGKKMKWKLYCCFCIHLVQDWAEEAVTIINGFAVCEDHMGIAQGGDFTAKLSVLKEQAKRGVE